MEKKAILLVEDNFLNRRLSKKVLIENGYTVLEAKNAKESMEILKRDHIDLVILDINLGEDEENGVSLGQRIKDKYNLPFIFLTAYDHAEIINKAVAIKPYSYLTKPFKNTDLIASIEIAIRQFEKEHKSIRTISVKNGEYNYELPIEEIDYIESEGNYLLFYCANQKEYKSRCTIAQIVEILPKKIFIQTHRAFIVNKLKVEKFSNKSVMLKEIIIPVSKNYPEALKEFDKQ